MSRYTKLLVTVSLLLNLLLLGIAFGYTGKGFMGCKASHRVNLHDLVQVLSAEKRQNLQKLISESEHVIKQQRDLLLEERIKASQLLEMVPFNKEAYFSQVKVIELQRSKITDDMAGTISKIAQQSTDEERHKMADFLIEKQKAANAE